jgi:Mrp family chromosome partitioning ATPase
MDLLSYFRILRRRWLLIVLLTLVGGAIGAASTQLEKSDPKTRTYYKATNTLVLDSTGSSNNGFQSAFTNLDQIAILTTTGEVPNNVAKKLATTESGSQLAERIVTLTNGVTNTLDITAVAPSSPDAVRLADTFSSELMADLTKRDTDRYNKSRDSLNQRITNLQGQVNTFAGQIAANPSDGVARASFSAATTELGQALSDFGSLTAGGPPASRLSVLESAQSVPIGSAEYGSRLSLGQLGQNHLSANNNTQGSAGVISTSSSSTFKGPVSRGLLGALLGFLAGIGLALLLERLDHRIRSRDEAETAFGIPVLAEVPIVKDEEKAHEIASFANPMSRSAEAFRAVRSSLLFQRASLLDGQPPQPARASMPALGGDGGFIDHPSTHEPFVIMVTSAAPKEGKTTTTANLAAVFAEAGSSVLVVNCDFRRPTIHKYFGVDDEPRRVHDTMIPGVKLVSNVLSDPNSNPAQVLAAQRSVVAAAHGRFDVILIDTAPLLSANDAVELVGSADIVLIAARGGATTTDDAAHATDVLTRLDAPLGGVVLAVQTEAKSNYYYYYGPGKQKRASTPAPSPTLAKPGANGANGHAAAKDVDLFGDQPAEPTNTPKLS